MIDLTHQEPLSEQAVAKIRDLIQVNVDSHKGFETVAECVDHLDTKLLFLDMAAERKRFADELHTRFAITHEDDCDDGTFSAQMHRWWIELKSMITSGDRHAMLQEALRAEDKVKAMYEEVTPEIAGTSAYDLLLDQLVLIRATHYRLKKLAESTA